MSNYRDDRQDYPNRPYFYDECEHAEGSYVGSFVQSKRGTAFSRDVEHFDVYVFDDRSMRKAYPTVTREQHTGVCIRYGVAPEQYISPGTVANVRQSVEGSCGNGGVPFYGMLEHNEVYAFALEMITHEHAHADALAMDRAVESEKEDAA